MTRAAESTFRSRAWIWVAMIARVLLAHPGVARALQPLQFARTLERDVSGLVRGTPAFGDPTLLWTTVPSCSNAPGDELQAALIERDSLFVGTPRAIFSFNPPRPVGTCNPYRLMSDVVTDGTFVYYVDNQGPNGDAALWRRDRTANPGDASQFLTDINDVGAAIESAELLVFGDVVFAILHLPGSFDAVVEYDKNTGAPIRLNIDLATAGELRSLQFDGRFVYWVKGLTLRRFDTTTGTTADVMGGGITAYFPEGYGEECSPLGCEQYAFVLYGQGNALLETEGIGGSVLTHYTSPDPGAQIMAITRDGTHLFFIERRAVNGTFSREDRFYRLAVGDHVPDLLDGPADNGGPGFDGFTTDLQWLYFRDRVTHDLLRLANNAVAIAVHDLAATGLEITQGLQDRANDLHLIEGKRTVVRFYVQSNVTRENVPGVTASLQGANQRGHLGTLEPVNAGGKLITARFFPLRTHLDQDFQFELPLSWTTGGALSLTATVNPSGRIIEDNRANNSYDLGPIAFTPSPRMHVGYINFWYFLGGTLYRPSDAEVGESQRFMRRLYPLGEPSTAFDGPGLHFTVNDIVDFNLPAEVTRTAKDCVDRYKDPADRNMCASDYVHAQIAAMRHAGAIRPETRSYANIAQAPDPPGGSYFTRGYTSGFISSGPSTDRNYASHELGHQLGRAHPVPGAKTCGHSASDPNYPYASAQIEDLGADYMTRYAGLDFANTLPGTMTYLDAFGLYDTMAYCSPNWISDYTFNGMYDFLASNPGFSASLASQDQLAPLAGDWLIVMGTLNTAAHTGGFVSVRRSDAVMDVTPPVAGGFTLELRDAGGHVLARQGFAPTANSDGPGSAFDLVVPFAPGTTQLRVVEDASGATLAMRAVSANAPIVSNVVLHDAPDPVDGVVQVTWTAADPDGDALHADVLASRDGGQTYRPLMLGVDTTSIDLDTAMLGGGTTQLRVLVSDGVQTGHADSAPFTVPPRPPTLTITSPVDGLHADFGQTIAFEVEIRDLQDDFIPDAQITWSDAAGTLGHGRLLHTDGLQVGMNLVTVTATNSLGASGAAMVTVVVGDALVPLGPTLSVAPQRIAWHVADGESVVQVAQVDVDNAGDGELLFDVTSDAPWLRIDSALGATGLSTPRTLVVTSDPGLVPAGTSSRATLTFQSHANVTDVVDVPVELSKGDVFDHAGSEPPALCPGDCDGDGTVTVDELIIGVNIALGNADLADCSSFDTNADGEVLIDDLIVAVTASLTGC